MRRTWAAIALLACSGALAQGVRSGTVALEAGNWTVYRSTDPMTDRVRCVGVHKSGSTTQLNTGTLYVAIRGGIESITLRFGDQPARAFRLPSQIEKDINAVKIDGQDFRDAIETQRIRMVVSTLVNGVVQHDIDATGIREALHNIESDCPVVSAPRPPTVGSTSVCDEAMVARLRRAGVRSEQISAACKP